MSCQLPVASCRLLSAGKCAPIHPPTTHNPQPTTSNPQRASRAFSLTEILIVIALIVLMLALALPAFNFISGSRSVEGAQNQVSAFLSQARAQAVGLQQVCGVMFFIDPKTNRPNMALVQETPAQATDPATNYATNTIAPEKYLDLVSDAAFVPLPKGVRIQTLENAWLASVNPNVRKTDNYIGFNFAMTQVGGGSQTNAFVAVGGVILFDGYGRLISIPYGFRDQVLDPTANLEKVTAMGALLWGKVKDSEGPNPICADAASPVLVSTNAAAAPYNGPLYSSLGLVLFEEDPYQSLGYTDGKSDPDPRVTLSMGAYGSAESGEETWIDNNATAYFIDRYNGTLIKGQ